MRAFLSAFALTVVLIGVAPVGAQEFTQDYPNPVMRDFRLDFCRNFGTNCGQPAADLFCRELGYERATHWLPAGPVAERTLVFGDGRICEGPGCQAFALIRCAVGTPLPAPVAPQPVAPVVEAPPAATPAAPEVPVPMPVPRPDEAEAVAVLELPIVGRPFTIVDYTPLRPVVDRLVFLRQIEVLPAGAALFACSGGDCSVSHTADRVVSPGAADTTVDFNWNVSRVPFAGAALIQVSHLPFPDFANGAEEDYEPDGLVFSGRTDGKAGYFDLDMAVLGEALPPGITEAIFHVRILPVSNVALGAAVGQPSNVMRVYYGVEPPEAEPFQFFEPQIVAEAPTVELVSLAFTPHRAVEWPLGCVDWETYRRQQQRSFFERVGDAFKSVWDFASESYQWAKDRVIDIASRLTFGVIPDQVLSFALDAALVSVGIPPDIPNLDEMISGGLDHLAGEMAKAAVSQIPTADLAVTVGNLAADITVEMAADMAEDELRARLEAELERRSRETLIEAADAIAAAAATPQNGVLCTTRYIPPAYRVTVRNTGSEPLRDIAVRVGDSEGIYFASQVRVDLDTGQSIAFVTIAEPNVRDVWDNRLVRMEPMATSQNVSNWWNEYLFAIPTQIVVILPGHRECLGACRDTEREVLRLPAQLLTEPAIWPQ